MRHPVIKIGPRGGLIVREDGTRKEYQRNGEPSATVAPAVAPRFADMTSAAAECFNGTLRHGMEHGLVRGEDGRVYASKQGGPNSVEFDEAETKTWPSSVTMTHTHRAGRSFSADDVVALFQMPFSAIEAVAMRDSGGEAMPNPFRTYRMGLDIRKLTPSGIACLAQPEDARKLWLDVRDSVAPLWQDPLYSGRITHEQAQCGAFDEINRTVAAILGLEYEIHGVALHFGGPNGRG